MIMMHSVGKVERGPWPSAHCTPVPVSSLLRLLSRDKCRFQTPRIFISLLWLSGFALSPISLGFSLFFLSSILFYARRGQSSTNWVGNFRKCHDQAQTYAQAQWDLLHQRPKAAVWQSGTRSAWLFDFCLVHCVCECVCWVTPPSWSWRILTAATKLIDFKTAQSRHFFGMFYFSPTQKLQNVGKTYWN